MRITKKLIALILMTCMLFSFVACNDDDQQNDDTDVSADGTVTGDVTYTVKLVTSHGLGIEGATVYVHKSDAEFDLIGMPATTDENGEATFTLPASDTYSVQIVSLNKRYLLEDGSGPHGRYLFTDGKATVEVGYNPDYAPAYYTLGDKIEDFTVTDIDGEEHTLYGILGTKDMVMINLWYTGCGPCRAEFPAINTAYNGYKDKVEVLAIDCDSKDTAASIRNFLVEYGLSLDFPLIHDLNSLSPASFASGYYPTTVIVDRYGVICMIEIGGVPSASVWSGAFAYFTSDNYSQKLFKGIEDIPSVN